MADERKYPRYQVVDGFHISEASSVDIFRKALTYEPKDDDLFLASFPRSGTTFTQMIIHLIFRDGQTSEDDVANNFWQNTVSLEMKGIEAIEKRVKPETIKVHLPYNMTPQSDKAKYIFVVRNPKDVVVSNFHLIRNFGYCFENGDFGTFFDMFMDGKTLCNDYFDFVLSWYEHRHDPNVLFVYYENLMKDIRGEVSRLANFIDPLIGQKIDQSPDILESIIENSTFAKMKKIFKILGISIKKGLLNLNISKGLNHFIDYRRANFYELDDKQKKDENRQFVRKGIVGDWVNTFSDEQNMRMNDRIDVKLKGTEMYAFWKDGGYL